MVSHTANNQLWLDMEKELASLRAFKAACEGQKAVARFNWNEARFEWLTDYKYYEHHMKPLYLRPYPEAAELRMRVEELEDDLAALRLCQSNVEATHKQTLRDMQKQMRERNQQVAEACAKAAEAETKVARECLAAFGDNAAAHCQVAFVIRSGEWKKHMKGVMDIVEQLRMHDDERLYEEADVLMSEAADEITRLRQQVATLTEQLNMAVEALKYAVKQVPELGTVPGISAAIAAIQSSEVAGCQE